RRESVIWGNVSPWRGRIPVRVAGGDGGNGASQSTKWAEEAEFTNEGTKSTEANEGEISGQRHESAVARFARQSDARNADTNSWRSRAACIRVLASLCPPAGRRRRTLRHVGRRITALRCAAL